MLAWIIKTPTGRLLIRYISLIDGPTNLKREFEHYNPRGVSWKDGYSVVKVKIEEVGDENENDES